MNYDAIAVFDNGNRCVFELDETQIDDFIEAVFKRKYYKDKKSGVISWLPPEHLYHLTIKPNLESRQCQNQDLDLE